MNYLSIIESGITSLAFILKVANKEETVQNLHEMVKIRAEQAETFRSKVKELVSAKTVFWQTAKISR